MRANLIYNPNSGGTDGVSPDELCAGLAAAGYDPVYEPTNSEADLDALLKRVEGRVVAVVAPAARRYKSEPGSS